ncbi:methyltransferase [Leucobacter denitrificans]|uniref:Methyltransferase n=2 Tax=Leucobacter denitrificans TaxID=683042 RepID=A0A7G9S7V2_9MICO|nr:methyltransferase [Leucobacter denitrificans]
MRTAAPQLLSDAGEPPAPGSLAIIGDRHGALTLGAAAVLGARGIRTHQDPLLGERALARNADRLGLSETYSSHPLDASLLSGARTVIMQLPRGLEALDEIAWAIAQRAHPDVRVFAGGRVKHMMLAQNEVLRRYFGEVKAGLGWRKARVLETAVPRPVAEPPFPKWGVDRELPFKLAAFGATFGGPKLDHGSRLLLSTLRSQPPAREPKRVLDLGCGNGVLAVSAALTWPDAEIVASDQSEAAVRATALTAEAAGVSERLVIHRADGTEAVPDASIDLVLLNPPFHTGATVHAGVAHRLIRDCARVLRPGGELRIVYNSHLAHRPLVEAAIGPVRQLARDKTFTVLAATTPLANLSGAPRLE